MSPGRTIDPAEARAFMLAVLRRRARGWIVPEEDIQDLAQNAWIGLAASLEREEVQNPEALIQVAQIQEAQLPVESKSAAQKPEAQRLEAFAVRKLLLAWPLEVELAEL